MEAREAAGGEYALLALKPDDPPARPEERAASASSGENAPAIIAAATIAAKGSATDLRMLSSPSLLAWQTTFDTMRRVVSAGLDIDICCLRIERAIVTRRSCLLGRFPEIDIPDICVEPGECVAQRPSTSGVAPLGAPISLTVST